ncbi:MAG TPA: tRNA preQ1(34) S-adenosylmethionine ribosyltransferase-isomerase QueA [Pirellulaceae bacterium]|nr:tRNA preQ1(34) S-adenosylmethionine ribosyltransferase-isomerase QueA [Pirellulaceae bacterium]
MSEPDTIELQDRLEHYDYELPKQLIAQSPLPTRDQARLLIVHRETSAISHAHVHDLPQLLNPGDLLVLNDTRVIPAKLVGFRASTRGRWQGLFLESDEHGVWRVLAKTRGKLQPGEKIVLQDRHGTEGLELTAVARLRDGAWAVKPVSDRPWNELLESVGRVPLPQYIREGNMVDDDRRQYQTVYASKPGSVAAPTAGLHFTKSLLEQLIDVGARITRVTLHVGTGTFKPIAVDDIGQHQMHSEWGSIDDKAIAAMREARQVGGRVIAVGTTTTRLLETHARHDPTLPWSGRTELFIRPPFEFKAIDGLLTNFHLPRSTLLVLARTFGGDELIARAYRLAVEERYRFYSYGDAMIIL